MAPCRRHGTMRLVVVLTEGPAARSIDVRRAPFVDWWMRSSEIWHPAWFFQCQPTLA